MTPEEIRELLRRERQIKAAARHQIRGVETGNQALVERAASLETRATIRADEIAMQDVSPYSD